MWYLRMSSLKSPRVTFDTNVCNWIDDPNKPRSPVDPADATAVRDAISDGRIEGFISEASLFVECLSFPDKLAYLAVAGTSAPRPQPDPLTVTMYKGLERLGIKLLHAPLIGAEIFIEGFAWGTGRPVQSERPPCPLLLVHRTVAAAQAT